MWATRHEPTLTRIADDIENSEPGGHEARNYQAYKKVFWRFRGLWGNVLKGRWQILGELGGWVWRGGRMGRGGQGKGRDGERGEVVSGRMDGRMDC